MKLLLPLLLLRAQCRPLGQLPAHEHRLWHCILLKHLCLSTNSFRVCRAQRQFVQFRGGKRDVFVFAQFRGRKTDVSNKHLQLNVQEQ